MSNASKTIAHSGVVGPLVKAVGVAALAVFIWVQGVTLLGPGGILAKYTFMEGFTEFPGLMSRDPLSKAGFIDLLVVAIFLFVVIVNGVPRGKYYLWITSALILTGIVYPGFSALLFLILYWKRFGQFRPTA